MTLRRKVNFSDSKESNAHTHAAHAAVTLWTANLWGILVVRVVGLRAESMRSLHCFCLDFQLALPPLCPSAPPVFLATCSL